MFLYVYHKCRFRAFFLIFIRSFIFTSRKSRHLLHNFEKIITIQCMQYAMKEAGLSTSQIDYINVHGTSTPLGDVAETHAIQSVFGDDAYGINISSTKSMTGHLLGAAGAIEAIASILSLNHNFIPPTINHFEDDPEIDARLNFTFNEAQQRDVKAVMSNGFGFGGHNTSLIFGRV